MLTGTGFCGRSEYRGLITDVRESKQLLLLDAANIGLILMYYSYGLECGQDIILRRVIAATGGNLVNLEGITEEIIAETNQQLNYLIDQLKKFVTPVYLRIGFEFDNIAYCYSSKYYKEAFRGIKKRLDERKAYNVATVWHAVSGATDFPTPNGDCNYSDLDHYDKWYPGDEYVDWIGFSSFLNGNYNDHQIPCWCNDYVGGILEPQIPFRQVHDRILNFGRSHNKPVMIAESGPWAYDIANLTASCYIFNYPLPVTAEKIWLSWFEECFDYIEKNKDIIRILSYIGNPWQSQVYWYCPEDYYIGQPDCRFGYWGNTRAQDNNYILNKFKEKLKNTIY